ncbi:MAG: gliding motility lipoprotein GldH [Bacteroidales bacterium]|nr:gliding motility lipoprotein GldH [Bacteroidales bacterium]
MTRTALSKLLVIVVSAALLACNHRDEYSAFATLDPQGWAFDSVLTFEVDTLASGQLPMAVALRHNNSYPYRNLCLEVRYTLLDNRGGCDTIDIEMADHYGRWRGKGLGASYQLLVEMPQRVELLPGSNVNIRHIMRVDTIRGIEMVGLSINASPLLPF